MDGGFQGSGPGLGLLEGMNPALSLMEQPLSKGRWQTQVVALLEALPGHAGRIPQTTKETPTKSRILSMDPRAPSPEF